MIVFEATLKRVVQILQDLHRKKCWGKFIVQFRAGEVVMTELNQTVPSERLGVASVELISLGELPSGYKEEG